MNCLLLREMPFRLNARLLDSLLSGLPDMQDWLVYLSTAFLVQASGDVNGFKLKVAASSRRVGPGVKAQSTHVNIEGMLLDSGALTWRMVHPVFIHIIPYA